MNIPEYRKRSKLALHEFLKEVTEAQERLEKVLATLDDELFESQEKDKPMRDEDFR